MTELEQLLNNGDKEQVEEYLNAFLFEFYNSDKPYLYQDYYYGIEGYDLLAVTLGLDNPKSLVYSEIIDREAFQDIIQVYSTTMDGLYFIRMEQYGYADEDALIYRIVASFDFTNTIEDCKEFMANNDFIKGRNNNIKQFTQKHK